MAATATLATFPASHEPSREPALAAEATLVFRDGSRPPRRFVIAQSPDRRRLLFGVGNSCDTTVELEDYPNLADLSASTTALSRFIRSVTDEYGGDVEFQMPGGAVVGMRGTTSRAAAPKRERHTGGRA